MQSGNYSQNSIPFNETDGGDPDSFVKGNRDMGVADLLETAGRFFAKVLRSDMKLELDAGRRGSPGAATPAGGADPGRGRAGAAAGRAVPEQDLRPAGQGPVTPVLTPDNYMDVIPDFLESATKSIYIENQYIRSKQAEVIKLLAAIKKARDNNPDLEVRIILGKIFGRKDVKKEQENIANLKKIFGLKMGENIRLHRHQAIRPLSQQVHRGGRGRGTRRLAELVEHGCRHEPRGRGSCSLPGDRPLYAQIFESDWATARKKFPKPGQATVGPEVGRGGSWRSVPRIIRKSKSVEQRGGRRRSPSISKHAQGH